MTDLHTAVVPLSSPFLDRLATGNLRWARLASAGTTGDVLGAGKLFRTVRRVAWDLGERRELVAAHGGTSQLLSAMLESVAADTVGRREGLRASLQRGAGQRCRRA